MSTKCAECEGGGRKTNSSNECSILVAKTILGLTLLSMLYVAVTCPCKPQLYSCHLGEMYIGVGVIISVLFYFNGFRVKSYNIDQRR